MSGPIVIPFSAQKGNTRMRVSMSWGSYAPYCGNFNYGEVEDDTIKIKSKIIGPKDKKVAARQLPVQLN